MNAQLGRYHVVATRTGRILALFPARTVQLPNGGQLGWRPVARTGQQVAEVDLTAEHVALSAHELLDAYAVRVEKKSGLARLMPRAASRTKQPGRRATKRRR